MTFKTMMADDMDDVFLNISEFGETITFVPNTGDSSSIKAVVDRSRLLPQDENNARTLNKDIEIYIANDATNGVTSVNVGLDKVQIPEYLGDSAINWKVVEILRHDDAMWHLRCKK